MYQLLYMCCTLAIERVVLLFNPLLLVKLNTDTLVTFTTHVGVNSTILADSGVTVHCCVYPSDE